VLQITSITSMIQSKIGAPTTYSVFFLRTLDRREEPPQNPDRSIDIAPRRSIMAAASPSHRLAKVQFVAVNKESAANAAGGEASSGPCRCSPAAAARQKQQPGLGLALFGILLPFLRCSRFSDSLDVPLVRGRRRPNDPPFQTSTA
jgi:hypothetical protein